MNTTQNTHTPPPPGTGPGSSGEENADMDRDMTADAETDKSAEAPGHDPAKKDNGGPQKGDAIRPSSPSPEDKDQNKIK